MRNGKVSVVNKSVSLASPLAGQRIIIVLGSLELGGAERQAILLASRLIRKYDAKVDVWGLTDPGGAIELCQSCEIPWKLVPLKWGRNRLTRWPKAVLNFAKLLRKERPDVLLPYYALSNVICGLSWRLSGAKTCIWNQRDEGRSLPPSSRTAQWALRATPDFVSNSQIGADYLIQTFSVPQEQISIVHNGVELAPAVDTRDAWRKRLGISQKSFVACMVANLHAYKDHITLLKAWRLFLDQMQRQGRDTVLLLTGRLYREADQAKALAFDLNLGSSVRFLGSVQDVTGLLSAVDLGVFSSKTEGCPNAVLECMASGLAVVGTDIPGIREALGPDGTDCLASPDDPGIFAQRILDLANAPTRLSALGAANRLRISAEFSTDQMVQKMVTKISQGLARSPMLRPHGRNDALQAVSS